VRKVGPHRDPAEAALPIISYKHCSVSRHVSQDESCRALHQVNRFVVRKVNENGLWLQPEAVHSHDSKEDRLLNVSLRIKLAIRVSVRSLLAALLLYFRRFL
jgi:hypothetical protein